MEKVVVDDVPSVEDRTEEMRKSAAALFLAFDAFADNDGESGNFGQVTRDGYRGFAEIARAIYADTLAIYEALGGEPSDPKQHASPLSWPAPEVE